MDHYGEANLAGVTLLMLYGIVIPLGGIWGGLLSPLTQKGVREDHKLLLKLAGIALSCILMSFWGPFITIWLGERT